MPPSVPGPVQRLVDEIAARFRPERIILFGSHAAGTADSGSDIDLLVVMETSQPVLRQAATISRAVDHVVPMDVLVRTPDQVDFPNPRDLLLRTILVDGRIVYDARG